MKLIKFLIFLVKTNSYWCATLNSELHRKENRNIIDNTVDKDHNGNTGQQAWAGSGSHKCICEKLSCSAVDVWAFSMTLLSIAIARRVTLSSEAGHVQRHAGNAIEHSLLYWELCAHKNNVRRLRWNDEIFLFFFVKEKLEYFHFKLQSKLGA